MNFSHTLTKILPLPYIFHENFDGSKGNMVPQQTYLLTETIYKNGDLQCLGERGNVNINLGFCPVHASVPGIFDFARQEFLSHGNDSRCHGNKSRTKQ